VRRAEELVETGCGVWESRPEAGLPLYGRKVVKRFVLWASAWDSRFCGEWLTRFGRAMSGLDGGDGVSLRVRAWPS
jgi:hypothetical protein